MEFLGYVIKIGNCYFKEKVNSGYVICRLLEGAMVIITIDYASKIAEETGGTVKHLYASDKKLD